MVADVLLIQTYKTRDQQCCASKQRHRKRDLRTHEDFSEALLPYAAAHPAAAFLKPIYQVAMRALKCRINSHQQPGQNRQRNCEAEHGKREVNACVGIERQKIRSHFRNQRDQLPRQRGTQDSGEKTHEQTLKYEQPDDARAGRANRHSQRDLTTAAAEPDQQQICNIAAGDEQDESHRGEQRRKRGAQISAHVLRKRL